MAKVVLPGSSVNKPADELGAAPQDLQVYGKNVIDYGAGGAPKGFMFLGLSQYDTPIYQWDGDPRKGAYFFPTAWSLAAGSGGNVAPGTWIPDMPDYVPGGGHDNIMLIERASTGEIWNVWMARQPGYNTIDLFRYFGASMQNLAAGVAWKNPQHTAAGVTKTSTLYRNNSRTPFERGNGMPQRALMVTVDEMLEGVIKHALQLTICNSWVCPTRDAKAGVDYLFPAYRCEWLGGVRRNQVKTSAAQNTPEGLRLRYKLTKAERMNWLDATIGSGNPGFRWFCSTYLDAMCDYGWVITDTGDWGMVSQFDGIHGPARNVYRDKFGIAVDNPTALSSQCNVFAKFMLEWRDRSEVVAPAA